MSPVVELREWDAADPSSHSGLRRGPLDQGEVTCLHAINESRRLSIIEVRDGLRVECKSSVGSIALGSLTLRIRPKLADNLVPIFTRYALHLPDVWPSMSGSVLVVSGGFVDLVAHVLLEEVDNLLHRGIFQDYRTNEAWLASPKGKLRFSALARKPSTAQIAVPCRFAERTPDIQINRLVRATLAAIRPAVSDVGLAVQLYSRERLLRELCGESPLSRHALDEAHLSLDRRTSYYEPLLDLAELVLDGMGPAFEGSRQAALPGFLFDMNSLFERFVTRLCREYAPAGTYVEVQASVRAAYRFRANPYHWPVPRPQPDIIVRRRDGSARLILDAKYKSLGTHPPDAADLYQLTLYSMSLGGETHIPARIVYPSMAPSGAEPVLEFVGLHGSAAMASVSVYGLDLATCAEAIRTRDQATLRGVTARLLAPPT